MLSDLRNSTTADFKLRLEMCLELAHGVVRKVLQASCVNPDSNSYEQKSGLPLPVPSTHQLCTIPDWGNSGVVRSSEVRSPVSYSLRIQT